MGKKVGICFKGGLARGFGAVGSIRYFQEENIEPIVVAGSSSGSIMAALMALQLPWHRAAEVIRGIKFRKLVSPMSFLKSGALVPYEHMARLFTESMPEIDPQINMEDLPTKLMVFVTDPVTKQRVIIEKGSLRDALICSCGYPIVFENIKLDGKYYLDGDLAPGFYPELLRDAGADKVIGISYSRKEEIHTQAKQSGANKLLDLFRIYLYQANHTHDELDPVDLEISYEAGDFGYFNFKGIDQLIARAYQATQNKSQEIRDLMKGGLF